MRTSFKIKKHFFLLLVGTLISLHCSCQEDSTGNIIMRDHALMPTPAPTEEIFYKGSVEAGAGEIIPITNKALRTSFSGVYDLHLSGNYVIAPHIFAGLELEDAQLGNAFVNAVYNTQMTLYDVGVKIGYYTYMQNDFLFCYSLSAGPSLIIYSDAVIPAPRGGFREQSFFARPEMLAGYRVNDELRVGIDISILLLGYHFNPATTGISEDINYDPSKDINGLTTCVGLGFGIYWAFDESKK
jgi:hypothetical protein